MSIFKFKQFSVDQTGCAMKINTDGVLLGALSAVEHRRRVVDIGTGTGVIAMMLAQRNPQARINAIDVDEGSAALAQANVLNSPFSERIKVDCIRFQQFIPDGALDLIISNPPFFTNALQNPDERKSRARHADFAFFEELLSFSGHFLQDGGALEVIVPVELARWLTENCRRSGLSLTYKMEISSFPTSNPFREVLRFEKGNSGLLPQDRMYVYEEKGVYSVRYAQLLQPFFLIF